MSYKRYQVFSRKVVYQCPWFQIVVEDVQKPDGFRGNYFIMERPKGRDFVIVIVQENDDLYLVNQWRPTLKKDTLEFAAGSVGERETDLEAAKREVAEELGLKAKKWIFLGKAAVAPGFSSQYGRVFYATGISQLREKFPGEAGENTEGVKIKRAKFDQMIYNGKIVDGTTLSAYLLYLVWEKKL